MFSLSQAVQFLDKSKNTEAFASVFGGDKRDRTADLLNAIQALSQLSYTPIIAAFEVFLSATGVILSKRLSFVNNFFKLFSFYFFGKKSRRER